MQGPCQATPAERRMFHPPERQRGWRERQPLTSRLNHWYGYQSILANLALTTAGIAPTATGLNLAVGGTF
jgi:hypothetical protein